MTIRKILDLYKLGLLGNSLAKIARVKPKFGKPPRLGSPIELPGQNTDLHTGFVNCRANSQGLRAQFFDSPDCLVAMRWTESRKGLDSYPGLLHGGISVALIDELMAYAVFKKVGYFGITLKLDTQFFKAVGIGTPIVGAADIIHHTPELVKVKAQLFRDDQKVSASAEGLFFIPTLSTFQKLTELKDVPDLYHRHFRPGKAKKK